jgi:hypothetical protein
MMNEKELQTPTIAGARTSKIHSALIQIAHSDSNSTQPIVGEMLGCRWWKSFGS